MTYRIEAFDPNEPGLIPPEDYHLHAHPEDEPELEVRAHEEVIERHTTVEPREGGHEYWWRDR